MHEDVNPRRLCSGVLGDLIEVVLQGVQMSLAGWVDSSRWVSEVVLKPLAGPDGAELGVAGDDVAEVPVSVGGVLLVDDLVLRAVGGVFVVDAVDGGVSGLVGARGDVRFETLEPVAGDGCMIEDGCHGGQFWSR